MNRFFSYVAYNSNPSIVFEVRDKTSAGLPDGEGDSWVV